MEIKIDKDGSLAEHFINSALKNWDRHCISDFTGKKLTYGQTFAAAEVLSKKIDELTIGQDRIGILLPPSIGGAVVNIAVGLLSKVSVNLNYIAGNAAIESAVKQSVYSLI
jgi:acyl-[acyl-carrier-protein]-phospholipid O-acyltransferase/long-chain-fatty-acid--[acyl-carrier-protein] ligase